MVIVFSGHIGQCGTGGQAWANLQYLLGLQKLGHEVYYLEDVGEAARIWSWELGDWTGDPSQPARYIRSCLEPLNLGDRWIYRAQAASLGMPLDQFREICREANLFIMRAVPLWTWRSEYDLPRRRVFIDVDPAFTQFSLANDNGSLAGVLSRCDHLFTVAQRIDKQDCTIPSAGFQWHPTLPPVSLDHWPWASEAEPSRYSTIMRWQGFRDVSHEGVSYGQKDQEFPKFLDLPTLSKQRFQLALLGGDHKSLTAAGWEVQSGGVATATTASYHSFIQNSRGEFSVAKEAYRATKSGWFSDRSVCYLSSGRPVVLQTTGPDDWLPHTKAILRFASIDEAIDAFNTIDTDYASHRRAARDLAIGVFSTDIVLPAFLEVATG